MSEIGPDDARRARIFDARDVPEDGTSRYPAPFQALAAKRFRRRLGNAGGLGNFGVNLARIAPGGQSSARHWHTVQDEFIYVLEGAPTLVTEAGRTRLAPGMCAAFPAGAPDGHCLLNETDRDVLYLEVGDRLPDDAAVYPDVDLAGRTVGGQWQFTRRNGTPYEE
jgi:uncharacterized cupin superfamily protein